MHQQQKRCNKCGNVKILSSFMNRHDDINPVCNVCRMSEHGGHNESAYITDKTYLKYGIKIGGKRPVDVRRVKIKESKP